MGIALTGVVQCGARKVWHLVNTQPEIVYQWNVPDIFGWKLCFHRRPASPIFAVGGVNLPQSHSKRPLRSNLGGVE